MTKIIVSLSGGRSREWFNNLTAKEQREYLKKYPKSEFIDNSNKERTKRDAKHRNAMTHVKKMAENLGFQPMGEAESITQSPLGFDVNVPIKGFDPDKDARFEKDNEDKWSTIYKPKGVKDLPKGAYIHHDKETGVYSLGWSSLSSIQVVQSTSAAKKASTETPASLKKKLVELDAQRVAIVRQQDEIKEKLEKLARKETSAAKVTAADLKGYSFASVDKQGKTRKIAVAALLKNPRAWASKAGYSSTLKVTYGDKTSSVAQFSAAPSIGHLKGRKFKGYVVSWSPTWAKKFGIYLG